MNEERIGTIEQIEQFLEASASIEFSASGDIRERSEHISPVLKRFDYTYNAVGTLTGYTSKSSKRE